MSRRSFSSNAGRVRATTQKTGGPTKSPEEVVRELKADDAKRAKKAGPNYREQSLALHGKFCGHCGKEFEGKNLHQLTVHHKDSNANNNPPDGSNWENLCVYCHDNVHGREMLGDTEQGAQKPTENTKAVHTEGNFGSLGDLLAAKLKGNK